MITVTTLGRLCDWLVEDGLLFEGQVKDLMSRYIDKQRQLMIAKRKELRQRTGRRRVAYDVSPVELVSAFRFKTRDGAEVTEEAITRCVGRKLGLPYYIPDPLKLDYALVTNTFRGPFAERHLVLPVAENAAKTELTVAVGDAFVPELVENLRRYTEKEIKLLISPKSELLRLILEYYGFKRSVDVAAKEFGSNLPDLGNLEQLYQLKGVEEIDAADRPIVQAVSFLLNYAFDQRASDIHIEPHREISIIRLRIDGVLHRIHMLPKALHPAVVSRIKTLSRLDIAERRRPQDGRIKTKAGDTDVELRVSTVPTAFGEKAVIRVFDPSVVLQDIADLGFFTRDLAIFENMISRPNGLILVTGPTGSGKTTTLYSALEFLASPHVNICTIEDPIEMVHEGFNQMAIQPKIDFTFANALRHTLRQDPDIVMVGEIRDAETAEMAIQAAQTGHLVLSTLHTNDAASAVARLQDLGIPPFLVADTLVGVIAQRLVRRICNNCTQRAVLAPDQAVALGILGAEGRRLRVHYGSGCARCRDTGYRGRTGVFEMLEVTGRIAQLIAEGANTDEIKRQALNDGMMTLREYAIKKLAQGVTTFDEVRRVTVEG